MVAIGCLIQRDWSILGSNQLLLLRFRLAALVQLHLLDTILTRLLSRHGFIALVQRKQRRAA